VSDPRAYWSALLADRKAHLAALERRSLSISMARVVSFVVGAAALGTHLWARTPGALPGAIGLLVAFVGLVIVHARLSAEEERTRAAIELSERGLSRLSDELDRLPPRGEKLAEPPPYAGDLDLFGARSVLALLDAMDTDASEARLAAWLSTPGAPDEVRARQAASGELSQHPALLVSLFVAARAGARGDREASVFTKWCAEGRPVPGGPVLRVLGIALPLATLTTIVAGSRLGWPESAWMAPMFVSWIVTLGIAARGDEGLFAAQRGARALGRHAATLEALSTLTPASPQLAAVATRLSSARAALARLDRIAGFIEPRENALFRWGIGPVVLYDAHVALALSAWQRDHGAKVAGWLDDLAELLALAGLAVTRFERPDWALPELAPGPSRFEAEGLAHPLLPATVRVPNDVRFAGPGTALLITGSNMSGKSTLMRSVGVAAVMAQAGAPVCAKRLVLSPLDVRTSIRVSDSLAAGVSHFYAELLALRRVVDDADAGRPVLFLLDEILHGTNSRERQAGAKAVIGHLLDHGAMGAVSTHDLGLASLVDERQDTVRAVHLIEQAEGDKMTFDYLLRDGVATSGNALRLMKTLGLPVQDAT
jgi:hypothetical protein